MKYVNMRSTISLLLGIVIYLLVTSDSHKTTKTKPNYLRNYYRTYQEHAQQLNLYKREIIAHKVLVNNSEVSDSSHKLRHQRHHQQQQQQRDENRKLKNLNRCRRYTQNYYGSNYNRVPNNCYNPQRCPQSYCSYCPTSNCRRRCPYVAYNCPYRTTTASRAPSISCNCDPKGSQISQCEATGQCRCKSHYTGLNCDRCEDGYYKHKTGNCVACECNIDGSLNKNCDQETGQCPCKPGAGTPKCSSCLPNYFGDIISGCKKCDPCDKEGHICDIKTGKCVCPPLTIGRKCEKCAKNAWGYEPGIGCKACDCSTTGSSKGQCDRISGRCTCRIGYEGEKCDRCSFGYYIVIGQKQCRKCNCNIAGTLPEDCSHGDCRCNEDGCRCKPNVVGKYCDQCKEGTYGVDAENPLGCTDCFCFGRSKKCSSSEFTWDQIRTDEVKQTICRNEAVCWILPTKFLGDLTTSYGGYLRISSGSTLTSNYKVYMTGNQVTLQSIGNEADIKIIENSWRILNDNNLSKLPIDCSYVLTRQCLMVILQNVTNIEIEPGPTYKTTEFNEILLDKATDIFGMAHVLSVERCDCPMEYTSLSCQDPNAGYYRYRPKEGETDNYIDKIVGIARRCHCNERSNLCDAQTGHCWNCTKFTTGPHCEFCAEGYYKDASSNCLPCPCPSEKQNFAQSCIQIGKHNDFKCNCKPGYTGAKCNRCEDTYYGNPQEDDGLCQACNCNPYGSEGLICNKITGNCRCKPGFTGKHCSECMSPREVIQNGICTPCDECTQILFNTIDYLSDSIKDTSELFKNGIGPPWSALNNTFNRYDFLSKKYYNNIVRANDLIEEGELPQLQKRVRSIEKKLNKTNKELVRHSKSINNMIRQSYDIAVKVKELKDKINSLIKNLDNFGNSQINTQEALKEAEQILKEIEDLASKSKTPETYRELWAECQSIYDKIGNIYLNFNNPNETRKNLDEFKRRLSAMNGLLDQTEATTKVVKNKNKQNTKRIEILKDQIKDIDQRNNIINDDLAEALRKINGTSDILLKIEEIYEILSQFDIKKTAGNMMINDTPDNSDIYDLLSKVSKHVRDLEESIKNYKSLFNFTKDEWKKINASGAYDSLIKGIDDANQKARDAQQILENALILIYPDGDEDSLPDKTNLAMAYSDRLKQRVKNLKNPKNDFKKVIEDLEKLKYDILKNGRNNNDLTNMLHSMNQQIKKQSKSMDDLEKVKEDARNISNNMTSLEQKVKDLNISTQYEFIKTYNKYANLVSSDEINKMMDQVTLTRLELQKINVNFTNLDIIKNANNEKFLNTDRNLKVIESKLNSLKNKIQFTREMAHSIDVGLMISNCQRFYKFDAGAFTSLSITYNCTSCDLFYLSNDKQQFISIKVHKNKVVLNWNNETRSLKSSNSTATINIERVGSIITMKLDDEESEPIFEPNLFKFTNNDKIQVGKLSKKDSPAFACVQKLIFNDQVIGFWNFESSKGGCPGCRKNEAINGGENTLFNGDGYMNVTGARKINPGSVDIQFDITTFDENSLLFLAQDNADHCSYIAITVNNGRIQLKVRHINGTEVTLTTKKAYNNAIKTTINVDLLYKSKEAIQEYSLSVRQLSEKEDHDDRRSLPTSNVFKIRKSVIFFGGVPSIFHKSCIPVNTTSYLGYLQPLNHEYTDMERTISYNTKKQNGELQFTRAWFPGNGFLEFHPKEEYDLPITISFLLRTVNSNAFLMNINGIIDLIINNDKLFYKINEELITTTHDLSRDINFIEITIETNKINLNVNGANTEKIATILLPKNLQLYIGSDKNKKLPSFSGSISNIVINKSPISFNVNTVKQFYRVEIGRNRVFSPTISTKSSGGSSFDGSMKEMQNTQGCPLIANYETDPDAVKFGDKPESFIFIENSLWKKDYEIDFQFRTLYPNGLLLLGVGGARQQQYTVLDIQDGKIRLHMKGKRAKAVMFSTKINDGNWHSLHIKQSGIKKKRKFIMSIDKEAKKLRMPRNNLKNELYVGGIPLNFVINNELQLHPFRGCMRFLKINNVLQTLVKNKKSVSYNNIGQCFPIVEQGAYFGGDAYAIYKSDFKVNKVLELSFEFRTVEQNGILLSVSNLGNSPALSVELQNGAVVMTIDMGNGEISHVANNLDSEFTLCDNRWHNITALYSSFELTVVVDGIRKTWLQKLQNDVNSMMDDLEAPLYIGGLPDNVPSGTLKIKENFKGCIRKLSIDNSLKDWTDMSELNNVLLNSCPVVST